MLLVHNISKSLPEVPVSFLWNFDVFSTFVHFEESEEPRSLNVVHKGSGCPTWLLRLYVSHFLRHKVSVCVCVLERERECGRGCLWNRVLSATVWSVVQSLCPRYVSGPRAETMVPVGNRTLSRGVTPRVNGLKWNTFRLRTDKW